MNWLDRYLRPLLIVDERFPWFLPILGAIFLSLLANLIFDIAKSLWGLVGAAVVVLLSLAGGVVAVTVFTWRIQRRRAGRNIAVEDKPHPQKRRGLVALVSREETLIKAIEYHYPELKHCWLIVTPPMYPLAQKIQTKFQEVVFHLRGIDNEYDTDECLATVARIFAREASQHGLLPQWLIADITGGTKPMTAAVVAACIAGSYAIQHIPTAFTNGQPAGPLDPIEISFRTGENFPTPEVLEEAS